MGFRLIPDKAILCPYCRRFFRTWTGEGWHLVWAHTLRPNSNVIISVAALLLCIVAVVIGELFY